MRQRLSVVLILTIVSAVVLCSSLATAQQQPAAAPAAGLASDTDLDALLASRDWNALGAALSQPVTKDYIRRKLSWLKTRMENGAGFLVPLFYARDLWVIGSALKVDDPAKDMRVSAGLVSLYAYELIAIDGLECEDRSAPGNRATQLFTSRAAAFTFLKQQPPDLKSKIVDIAIALERKTSPLRKDDDLICRGGLEQIRAGLERGQQQQVPTPEGHIGKTIAVTPPADWVPKFVAPDVYRPLQDKARATMRENLLKLIGEPS
jgi:hypothetical protein